MPINSWSGVEVDGLNLVIIRSSVEGMVIRNFGTINRGMSSFLLLRSLPFLPQKNSPPSSLVLITAQLIYISMLEKGFPASMVMMNVIVISLLQQQAIQNAVSHQVSSQSVAENRKFSVCSTACYSAGISFIPLTVETFDGWKP